MFGSFIFSDKMIVASDQLNTIDSKVFGYTVAMKENKQFPLWFPSRLGGMPTIDALYGDILYFPSTIMHLLLDEHRVIGYKFIVHVFLAGFFFYLLCLKGFKTSHFIAFTGGVFYMLNPEFLSHVYPGHDGKMYVIAMLPLFVLSLKVLMEKPTLLHSTFMAAILMMCLLTSHIQLTYFSLWGIFFYWLYTLIKLNRSGKSWSELKPHIGYFWFGIFLGVAMGVVQLYPAYQYVYEGFSVRSGGTKTAEEVFQHATSWSLHWPEVFSLWVPEFGNYLQYYWSDNYFKLNSEYAGAIPVILGIIAVVYKPTGYRILWISIAVFTVLFSLGDNTPLFTIVYYVIPGVNKFRGPSMLMFWYSFSLIMLTILFLHDIVRGHFTELTPEQKRKWTKGLLITGGVCTLLTAIFSMESFVLSLMSGVTESLSNPQKVNVFTANFSKNFLPFLWVWWIFALGTLGLVWAVMEKKISSTFFISVILIIGIIDTARVDADFIETKHAGRYKSIPQPLPQLAQEMKTAPFRCYDLPGALQNNAFGQYRLEGVTGFHDNELAVYRKFANRGGQNYLTGLVESAPNGQTRLNGQKLAQGNNYLNIANVKYYIGGSQKVGEVGVYENKGNLGRLSFVDSFAIRTTEEMSAALNNPVYNPAECVHLYEKPNYSINTTTKSQGTITWETYTPNYRKARVSNNKDALLRVSEVYYPGWEIYIDGQEVKKYQADIAWMAIEFPKGEHIVELKPKSQYLKTAGLVSFPLMGAVAILWLYSLFMFYKRKQK